MPENTHELVIGEYVQLFDVFTLNVDRTGVTKDVHQPSFVDFYIDTFGGETHVAEEVTEFAGRIRKLTQLLDSKFIEGENLSVHIHTGKILMINDFGLQM
jgi:hypothetical protein